MSLQDGTPNNHQNSPHVKSDPNVPIDPSIAASSPGYPQYSPYAPQPHDMSQYQGHPPPGYAHPHYMPQQFAGQPHGMPNGPYSSPGTAVSVGAHPATAGPRQGQVGLFNLLFRLASRLALRPRVLTRLPRFIPSSRFLALSNTSGRDVAMKRLNVCINVDGKVAKRLMAR